VDVLYLASRTDCTIVEVWSSNFFVILKDGTVVTPKLGSILPGITRDSVLTIARDIYKWPVEEREITLQEVLDNGKEVFFTGTAAVIVPVTEIHYHNEDHAFAAATGRHTRTMQLKEKLQAIQTCREPDPFGWVHEVRL
jgi:branched-chain amino acid aminotransferase